MAGGLLLALILLAGIEFFLRGHGYRPSLADSAALWSEQRARVSGDPDAVALLGDSRILLGFSLDVFRDKHPGRTISQLGIIGRPPLTTLQDLASDSDFVGSVIVDFRAEQLENRYRPTAPQDEIAEYHERWLPASRWPYHDAAMRLEMFSTFQSRLALLHPDLALARLLKSAIEEGKLPDPPYVNQRRDRSRQADYSLVDADKRRAALERLVGGRPDPGTVRAGYEWRVGQLTDAIDRIVERGGEVIVLRLPSSKDRFLSEDRAHPRQVYWDRIVGGSRASGIHYADVPSLAAFIPADSSHLDYRDSAPFTRALLDEIERRGLLSN